MNRRVKEKVAGLEEEKISEGLVDKDNFELDELDCEE